MIVLKGGPTEMAFVEQLWMEDNEKKFDEKRREKVLEEKQR